MYENIKQIQELSEIEVMDQDKFDLTKKAFWNIKTNICLMHRLSRLKDG